MKLKSFLIKGTLKEAAKFKICDALPGIKTGIWEICLSSIAFYYKKSMNNIVSVSTNFIQSDDINESGQTITKQAILASVHCSGKKGTKQLIGFKQRDFFEINCVQNFIQIDFKDLDTEKTVDGAKVYILILVRKKA